jgi:hypothetical protein
MKSPHPPLRGTFSRKGRRQKPQPRTSLLPLREKVAKGRMRGKHDV